MLIHLHLLVN